MAKSALPRLTMRCSIERAASPDEGHVYGVAHEAEQTVASDVRCYAWVRQAEQVLDGTRAAFVTTYRMMVAKDADVRQSDCVTLSSDRESGVLVTDQRLRVIEEPLVRRTHKELTLELVS